MEIALEIAYESSGFEESLRFFNDFLDFSHFWCSATMNLFVCDASV